MPHKIHARQTILYVVFLLLLFPSLFFAPTAASALGEGQVLPDFREFSQAVQNNQAGVLRGVYVPGVLAFPVVQQPNENAGYVSPRDGEITQFGMAAQYGNMGLLAHNNLSGRFFSQLAVGQEVRLVFGDGNVEYFVITQVWQYQALQPASPYSSFRDLMSDDVLTAEQMFKRAYTGDRHVTFQTCIAGPGSLSWGRLFVVATPQPQYSGIDRFGRQ